MITMSSRYIFVIYESMITGRKKREKHEYLELERHSNIV